jgi:hypothetical protein
MSRHLADDAARAGRGPDGTVQFRLQTLSFACDFMRRGSAANCDAFRPRGADSGVAFAVSEIGRQNNKVFLV